MAAEDFPFPPVPADAATDVPARYPDGDGIEDWYDAIPGLWDLPPDRPEDDDLYSATLRALAADEAEDDDDTDYDNPARVGPVS